MNFKQVQAFRAVMMTRSMTAAAALLHTSQPNVSRWIALLEAAVGFALFQRHGTRLIPTPEAEAFYADVERAFLGMDALTDTAASIRRRGTGLLRVGAVGSITQCVMPDALRRFRDLGADIPVVLHTGGSDQVAKWVATGFCDVGFCSFTVDLPGLQFDRINTAWGVAVVGRQHRLQGRSSLAPDDFAGEAFICLPAGSYNREAIDRHFRGVPRILSVETPYATTICSMVDQGLGVSIVNPVVSRAMRLPQMQEIAFDGEVDFHSYAVVSESFPASLLGRRMIDCARQAFARLGGA